MVFLFVDFSKQFAANLHTHIYSYLAKTKGSVNIPALARIHGMVYWLDISGASIAILVNVFPACYDARGYLSKEMLSQAGDRHAGQI